MMSSNEEGLYVEIPPFTPEWRLAAAKKDSDTVRHMKRVAERGVVVAQLMGCTTPKDKIKKSFGVHDVGDGFVALTRGPYWTDKHMEKKKDHAVKGREFLEMMGADELACYLAEDHHKKQGEKSYPKGETRRPAGYSDKELDNLSLALAITDYVDAYKTRDNGRNGDYSKLTHEKMIADLKRERPGNDKLIDALDKVGILR